MPCGCARRAGRGTGSGSEVANFAWALSGRDGRVSEVAVRRLREVARHRLERAGLPLTAGLIGRAAPR